MARKTTTELPVAKCKRLVRPLLAKIHVLTDLYHKYPSKFVFEHLPKTHTIGREPRDERSKDVRVRSDRDRHRECLPEPDHKENRDIHDRRYREPRHKYKSSLTSAERLAQLKSLLSPELHRSYSEIFAICRHIFSTLLLTGPEEPQILPQSSARLSVLAASKLGKLVALGTKSTYYQLNQALLFDAESIPPHLKKFHAALAEDIDQWLDMEPELVTRRFRRHIVAGYVIHILVYALRPMLFLLVPVVAHWLHEQGATSHLRTLFTEFWNFLAQDPDVQHVAELMVSVDTDPTAALFWPLHHTGYWEKLANRLGVVSPSFQNYEGLLLDCLVQPGRLDGVSDDFVISLAARNPQHPNNTAVLMGLLVQTICRMKMASSSASQTLETFRSTYSEIRRFVQAWLGLNGHAIFNSQDKGNLQLFESLCLLLRYIGTRTAAAIEYLNLVANSASGRRLNDMLRRFKFLYYHTDLMQVVVGLLQAYYLDKGTPDLAGLKPGVVAEFFAEFMADSEERFAGEFLVWVNETGSDELGEFARKAFVQMYPEDEWGYSGELKKVQRILFE